MQELLVEICTFTPSGMFYADTRWSDTTHRAKAETGKIPREIKLEELEHRLVGITSYKRHQALTSRRNKRRFFLVRIKVEIPNFEGTILTKQSSG